MRVFSLFSGTPLSCTLFFTSKQSQVRHLLTNAPSLPQGKSVILFEVARSGPTITSAQLVSLAKQYVSMGADALVVPTDAEATPEGFKDLFTVSQAVKVPVLARDYLIHPLQASRQGSFLNMHSSERPHYMA